MKIFVALLFLGLLVFGKEARTLRLNEKMIGRVTIHPGYTTILSFPSKPKKVLLGNRGLFGTEFVENDVAISALVPQASSNLFVYLENRRFSFDLSTGPGARR